MSKKILIIVVLVLTLSFSTTVFASLTFTTDAITGTSASSIDLGAGNALSLQTIGNGNVIIGSGNVGIGTSNPAGRLDLGTITENNSKGLNIFVEANMDGITTIGQNIEASSNAEPTTGDRRAIGQKIKVSGNYGYDPEWNYSTEVYGSMIDVDDTVDASTSAVSVGIQIQNGNGRNTLTNFSGSRQSFSGVVSGASMGGVQSYGNSFLGFSNTKKEDIPVSQEVRGLSSRLYNLGATDIYKGVNIEDVNNSVSAGDAYGVYINLDSENYTNLYGIYQVSSNALNYFAGNVGIGTTTPGASSILDISSTTKGVVLPRMTKVQRDAITTPVAGMAIYQTDAVPGLRVYNGTNWMRFTETAD